MFEFVLGVVMSPWVFLGVILFAILCEAGVERAGDWSGWSAFWAVPMFILGYMLLGKHFPDMEIGIIDIGVGLVGYLVLGSLWSLWRYRCYVADVVAAVKENYDPKVDITKYRDRMEDAKRTTVPSRHQGFIVFNIMLFPISFIAHLLEDVFRAVRAFVKHYMIGIFNTIHRKIFSSFE